MFTLSMGRKYRLKHGKISVLTGAVEGHVFTICATRNLAKSSVLEHYVYLGINCSKILMLKGQHNEISVLCELCKLCKARFNKHMNCKVLRL